MIAMVGSRRPSADGRRNAHRFASELVKSGLGVCSGLALGIDVESHAGALQGAGNTVAVLGTGIDTVYPTRNRAMFDSIAENGALLSEFNLGMPPLPVNFPRRNRIISGLSLGVLVVEAGLRSGSMITARFALEQGREVFAIPGSIHNPMTKGCHHLISQGAKLVQQVADIVDECAGPFITVASNAQIKSAQTAQLTAELAAVMYAIGHDPVTLDELLCETGLEIDLVSTALVELELLGLVSRDVRGFVLAVP
jgi:DNA processing protein